ncbi:hypothetical protein [Chryseobacterium sp. 18068]|uniref:hypothetical protein n=1 Tax=Chryseobacterium sp. 18068 TaxID=2681414 RepID=UPI00135C9815|nr:hypothetical protein [Chryseobacterium sp. 18068]
MTHTDLVEIGYRWVLNRCGFAFKELRTTHDEIPDVLGFNSSGTFLLEVKISRGDFLADKKKIFRIYSEKGIGDWRFFIVPKGLVKLDELPAKWGLIEVNEKGKAICAFNPFGIGNIYSNWERCEKDTTAEYKFMYSALRRLHLRNRIDEIYIFP